ncbi:hypothetical protein ACFYRN_42165 [Streptomyces sp. NPDC005227]|uniref:hypothetical protein n=1 Tax=Streptomyces sp. NPDC005227 TaxID=3364707 RepID=UPI0036BEA1CE
MALNNPHPAPKHPPPSGAEMTGALQAPHAPLQPGDEILLCGRPLSLAWEVARDAPALSDPHTTHCAYCREAVEGLAAVNEATAALRASGHPSERSVVDRVISAVRAEIRLGAMLPLDDPAGDLQIAENAAAIILRQAADSVPGIRAASCRIAPTGDGRSLHIIMTLAATLDRPLPERANQVRQAVLDAVINRVGLAVASIDLKIDTVLDPVGPAGTSHSEQSGP